MRSSGHGETWHVEIDPPSSPVESYYKECCISAEMIWAERQGELNLLYSGGLDSEYVLCVFRSLGMKIKPAIMRFTQGYNQPDVDNAIRFCTDRNIDYELVDLDFDHFVDSGELLEMASAAGCCAYEMPAAVWLAKQLDGTVLTGNDPPHLKRVDEVWYLDEEEIIWSQFNFWQREVIYGTPFFLSYRAEQMLSFLLEPTIVDLTKDRFPGKMGTNSVKVHVFNNGTDFNLRNRYKLTGYEFMYEGSEISKHPDIQTLLSWRKDWLGSSDHEYNKIVSHLSSPIK